MGDVGEGAARGLLRRPPPTRPTRQRNSGGRWHRIGLVGGERGGPTLLDRAAREEGPRRGVEVGRGDSEVGGGDGGGSSGEGGDGNGGQRGKGRGANRGRRGRPGREGERRRWLPSRGEDRGGRLPSLLPHERGKEEGRCGGGGVTDSAGKRDGAADGEGEAERRRSSEEGRRGRRGMSGGEEEGSGREKAVSAGVRGGGEAAAAAATGERGYGWGAAAPTTPRRLASSSAAASSGGTTPPASCRSSVTGAPRRRLLVSCPLGRGRNGVASVDDDEAYELVSGADLFIGGDIDDEGEGVRAYLLRLPRRPQPRATIADARRQRLDGGVVESISA
ncbi:hypothetical protein [Oryza sativa Japonica Group]|uniref:Uncharacterized protein n=1 Tax=Oryza sativa subsp. japonica TaxID=39947 RepID=Q5JML9_ORYSJ|nr:hypothetical protein [Oryza sativa Japonica Group]BAD87284.1 hypothetical protein [Oryza sativa Japonica Group]